MKWKCSNTVVDHYRGLPKFEPVEKKKKFRIALKIISQIIARPFQMSNLAIKLNQNATLQIKQIAMTILKNIDVMTRNIIIKESHLFY